MLLLAGGVILYSTFFMQLLEVKRSKYTWKAALLYIEELNNKK